ncbi:hypothetical protein M2167_000829 [Streptomyces sp. SPB4]|nr:hypothetical protein [Streptomyces sp. SPB4]
MGSRAGPAGSRPGSPGRPTGPGTAGPEPHGRVGPGASAGPGPVGRERRSGARGPPGRQNDPGRPGPVRGTGPTGPPEPVPLGKRPPNGRDGTADPGSRALRAGGPAPARGRRCRVRAGAAGADSGARGAGQEQQRPGHRPGAGQGPGVQSRGARWTFAVMPRSLSAPPSRVNPRPAPGSEPPAPALTCSFLSARRPKTVAGFHGPAMPPPRTTPSGLGATIGTSVPPGVGGEGTGRRVRTALPGNPTAPALPTHTHPTPPNPGGPRGGQGRGPKPGETESRGQGRGTQGPGEPRAESRGLRGLGVRVPGSGSWWGRGVHRARWRAGVVGARGPGCPAGSGMIGG